MAHINLICKKIGGHLRVRITSPGYLQDANCMFPRAIRVEGACYQADADAVKLVINRGKWFYSVRASSVRILDAINEQLIIATITHAQVFDSGMKDCVICMDAKKSHVFAPCGHYHCCFGCATRLDICPICRADITQLISHDQIC